MLIKEITDLLESLAPPSLQENYDNAGLITGQSSWQCSGIICTLDATEEVVLEAVEKKSNLIVAHHPIIFSGLKKINGKNYVEKAIITAIKNDIAVYAIHTNLDNIIYGVNKKMAEVLGLINCRILAPKENQLMKLCTFVPADHADKLRDAVFAAGAGNIGNYSECSFNASGEGTYKAGEGTNPFLGERGKRHTENEIKIEVMFPSWLQPDILNAMFAAHPYEEVAYDLIGLLNNFSKTGSGLIGELENEMSETDFLHHIKKSFNLSVIRHTPLIGKSVKSIALCGGAGSFLINKALAADADFYISADIKYHEFFDANGHMVIADIGHWESEQFTIDLLYELLKVKYPTFALHKTEIKTNPVSYFI